MKKRSEEIFCPKCKARGYRIYTLGDTDKVKYQCKICKNEWSQDTILTFMESSTVKDRLSCRCGGKFKFSKLHGETMRRMLKCNKCNNEKLE